MSTVSEKKYILTDVIVVNYYGIKFYLHRETSDMKRIIKYSNKFILLIFSSVLTAIAFAQDKKVDVNINTKSGDGGGNILTQPWVWVVGGAVFLLLLVALLRNNNSSKA